MVAQLVLQPILPLDHLALGFVDAYGHEIAMIERVGTDLECPAQLAQRRAGKNRKPFRTAGRSGGNPTGHVKRSGETVLCKKIGHAQIKRMSVIPGRGEHGHV
jgi:hypothetical protein